MYRYLAKGIYIPTSVYVVFPSRGRCCFSFKCVCRKYFATRRFRRFLDNNSTLGICDVTLRSAMKKESSTARQCPPVVICFITPFSCHWIYPPVIKHGDGTWTTYQGIFMDFPLPCLITRGYPP